MSAHPLADAGLGRRHQVVIIGSGFGGLNAAKKLKHADVDIKLIARTTHHLFQPLLYQVATGIISEGEIAPPTRGEVEAYQDIREETDQALEEVRSTHQRGHAPEVAVPDDPITAGGPVRPVSVEPARSRTHADLVVEPV